MKARPRRRRRFSLLTWLFVFRKALAFWLFLVFLYLMNYGLSSDLLSYSQNGAFLHEPLLQNISVLWLGPFKVNFVFFLFSKQQARSDIVNSRVPAMVKSR